MTCEEVRRALSDGGPAPDEHLRSCAGCRAWAASLERLPARLAAWAAPALPEGFERAVLARTSARPRWLRIAAGMLIFMAGTAAGVGARALARPAPGPADLAALGGAVEAGDIPGEAR